MKRPRVSPNHPSRHRPGLRGPSALGSATSRTLHLVDVDNLLGDPTVTNPHRIAAVFDEYRRAARFATGDHAVVATGCNPDHVLAVELGWPSARHCRRRGADGADMALLEEAGWAVTSRRYQRVVLGSGDRIFLDALDRLRAVDIEVDVVCAQRGLARALAVRANGHVHFLRAA